MTTFAIIIGNRGFFPDALARDGRDEILRVLSSLGYGTVCLTPEQTKHGAVESLADAHKCSDLFKAHGDKIDGVLVALPNFGDERAIANTLRFAGLDVPVLLQAFPDDPSKMLMGARRDSFCGKISACNNLWQYGIKYSLTKQHTVAPDSEAFKTDLAQFAATCRVVKGLKNARVGAIGARPAAFNTVRFSEKLMEHAGITVETLDLSEVFGRIHRLTDDDPHVKEKLANIGKYVNEGSTPAASLIKMSKFGVVVDEWMRDNELAGTSVQCWTAMQEFFGVVPCTIMSMMSNNLLPSACETDMVGMIGMYALQLASETPSAIVDWNNNFGDDPDKTVIFHCSNLPKHFFENVRMDFQEIIAGSVGKENTFGTIVGRMKSGPLTFCRVSTDDLNGKMRAYVGEGEITKDSLNSFGGYGVVKIPGLQRLLHYICRNGYEHHVAVNISTHGSAVAEALSVYKNWEVHHHA
ncbi:MAG TPA: L-fucose/L-arabinose isomerase family protein [Bryobacteraceae bacterium]|jgi:L-fucose isomerase-like protein|nr:L-fucose/L-arabinose isomerase family protein [Bryobacteraceae bacterium]